MIHLEQELAGEREVDTRRPGPLAEIVIGCLPKKIQVDWYGDPDRRSYMISHVLPVEVTAR